jgi:hypothetical protein
MVKGAFDKVRLVDVAHSRMWEREGREIAIRDWKWPIFIPSFPMQRRLVKVMW